MAARRVDFHMRGNSFSRWKYRQVDRFIAASDAIRQMLVADGIPRIKRRDHHEGIDVERVSTVPAAIHQELWLPTNAPIVGNVGALVPHKGQRYLVEATSLVLREVPDARFVILGEGELRAALERQVASRIWRNTWCCRDFAPMFSRCTAHSISSRCLRSPKASARPSSTRWPGLAVVGTRAGGIPEAVEDGVTGLLVPPGAAEALAERDRAGADDPAARQRMGEAGRARVEPSSASTGSWKARWRRIGRCWRGIQPRRQPASRPAARLPEGGACTSRRSGGIRSSRWPGSG